MSYIDEPVDYYTDFFRRPRAPNTVFARKIIRDLWNIKKEALVNLENLQPQERSTRVSRKFMEERGRGGVEVPSHLTDRPNKNEHWNHLDFPNDRAEAMANADP